MTDYVPMTLGLPELMGCVQFYSTGDGVTKKSKDIKVGSNLVETTTLSHPDATLTTQYTFSQEGRASISLECDVAFEDYHVKYVLDHAPSGTSEIIKMIYHVDDSRVELHLPYREALNHIEGYFTG